MLFFLGSQRISLLVNVNLSPKACSGSQRGRAPLGVPDGCGLAGGLWGHAGMCVFSRARVVYTFKIFSKTHLLKEALLMIPIPALIVSLLDNLSGWHACNASLPEAFSETIESTNIAWAKDKSNPTFS